MLGGYPMDRVDRAPQVRITRMREALGAITDLTFLSDTREGRRLPLLKLMGRLREFDAVYVEAASSTAMELDLLFYASCRQLGIPLGIYIRDAYQLYPYFYDTGSLKNRLLKWAWQVSIWRYERDASVLYFPTQGLSEHFHHPRKLLLPPAGRVLEGVDRSAPERRVIYVGGISKEYGADLLLEAMDLLAVRMPDVKLTLVCAAHDHPLIQPYRDRPWLDLMRLQTDELLPEMNRAAVAIIPFRPMEYPALSVKLLDYLSYGLPVVATPWTDVQRFIEAHGCGRIASPTPEGLAQALGDLLADPVEASRLGQAALATIQRGHTWEDRARNVVDTLLAARP